MPDDLTAQGHGPSDAATESGPPSAGGWGSIKAVAGSLLRDRPGIAVVKALALQNKHEGFT